MAYSRVKVWIAAEILTAADQNAEFSNCIDNENDLDTRLVAEIATRTTLESEYDTLQGNVWNAGASEIAANRVSQTSMKDNAVGTAELKALAVTHEKVAAANRDGAADTPSMRTLGTTGLKAVAGNDSRLLVRIEEFTSNGTFTAKSTKILIEMWGGGAGGGGGSNNAENGGGGGGGGAGAYMKREKTVVVGVEYSVVIGVGGAGGAGGAAGTTPHPGVVGSNGTYSYFKDATFKCNGGIGGAGGASGSGGAGGAGATIQGYPGMQGETGKVGEDTSSGAGGDGGKTVDFGGKPGSGGANDGSNGGAGAGFCVGGGGGGSNTNTEGAGGNGSDGRIGFVRITW
jgi:hypothetical protein